MRKEELTSGIKVLNHADGGCCPQLGKKLSEATKKKISESKKGKSTWTANSRAKLKQTRAMYGNPNIGRKASDEHRLKLSISHKGNQSALGHKLTDQSKLKIATKKSKFDLETLSKIKLMLEQNYSEQQIIKELNVTRWAVYSVKHQKRLINPL
jgi:hypothetical protein